jgi:hypothetical protein
MAFNAVVFNTTDAPVTTDDEGRTVGGGEWAAVDTTEDAVQDALTRGTLVEVDTPSDTSSINPDAKAAFDKITAPQAQKSTTRRSAAESKATADEKSEEK